MSRCDESPLMDAAGLLVYLEHLVDKGKAVHRIQVRVEVGDDHYDQDLRECDIELVRYDDELGWRLVFRGR